jgi:YHS domain-containing protein
MPQRLEGSMITRRIVLWAAPAILLGLAATNGRLRAQNSGEVDQPRLGLKGYDPVAYFTKAKPILGREELEYSWDEVRYRFASNEHREMFRSDPDRYVPQFAGSCAMGMSKGVKVEANPENWMISEGRLFVFYPSDGPSRFQANAPTITAAADRNWQILRGATFGTRLSQ